MIYIPIDNFSDYCVVVQDKDTIRAINKQDISGTYDYIDFFVNSHYLSKKGFTSVLPTDCELNITNSWYYRNDISDIFIICFIGALFIFGLPIIIFSRLFPRFKR